jgi:hypothetical protein
MTFALLGMLGTHTTRALGASLQCRLTHIRDRPRYEAYVQPG